jgi:hypothetical protein
VAEALRDRLAQSNLIVVPERVQLTVVIAMPDVLYPPRSANSVTPSVLRLAQVLALELALSIVAPLLIRHILNVPVLKLISALPKFFLASRNTFHACAAIVTSPV